MDGMEVKETEVTDEWQRKKFFNYVFQLGLRLTMAHLVCLSVWAG